MVAPLKRLALLLYMLLIVFTATASASSEQQQQQETTSVEAVDATDDRLSAAISGCGLCQRTGQCDQAFRGTPGQFCQTLVSAAPCCCPADAQCVLDNAYNCRCRRTIVSSNPNVRGVTHTTTTSSSSSGSSTIFFLLLMICCICCCCGAAEKRHRRHERQYQYAQPVYTASATQYGTNDQYAYPSAPPIYEERGYPGGGGGNNSGYAAGAVGAVAGLAAGTFLGSAFSGDGGNSHQQTTTTSYFAGDSGGATSTFDFSGDTGGDDGGDFAGDS